ncbi:MAG: helix-turn-helix transcriptional regulator [Bacteroidetes bacterium]|nr:helix-turn-helix transcriptional regulator [Bacteroidota bacterium]
MESNIKRHNFQTEAHFENEFQSVTTQKGQLLSKKIESAIKERHFNRQQFANLMGVQPSIITKWLSGSHNFTVETLFEIEDRLGIKLIAIEKPVYRQMNFHMVVGSQSTQPLNSSLVEGMLSTHVTYFTGSVNNFTDNCTDNYRLTDFFKFEDK